jgi:hypothetical protein
VAVNNGGQPVVLILGAYEPTVWNIGWTTGTRILAVLVSGYHRQALAGLDPKVPTINSSYDNRGPCGYFYLGGSDGIEKLNPISRKLSVGQSIWSTLQATVSRWSANVRIPRS